MINELRIQNFKCWKDTGVVHLAPLTVLFGSNSSGKSSIGQFLMLLKQSVEFSDRKTVFFTGNDNTPVDLGSPSDMVYDRNIENPIMYSYQWKLDEKAVLEFNDAQNKQSYRFDNLKFSSSVSVKDQASQTLEVNYFAYEMIGDNGEQVTFTFKKKDKESSSKRGYEMNAEGYQLVRSMGRPWDIPYPIRFYGFPDEAVAYYQNTGFIQEMNLRNEILFSNIHYLGPLRSRAKRLYTWTGRVPPSVGENGFDTIFAILAAKNEKRMYNLKYKGHLHNLEYIVAYMLKEMELIDDFEINRITDSRQDYDVKIKTKGSHNFVGIPDVGVGISQVLPVIVELFYAPPGSTIIIEQPELHLHPSAQAALADIIIYAIRARENEKDRNIQLLIETHSEHFLRRLQLRVAQDNITPNELSAYFVNTAKSPSALEPLQVDLFGNIMNWPKGFFGDLDGDIIMQSKAALSKRKRLSK